MTNTAKKRTITVALFALLMGLIIAVPALAQAAEPNQCQLTITNQHSTHQHTRLQATSDLGTYTAHNIEQHPNKTTNLTISYSSKDSITYKVLPGPSGLSSLNTSELDCVSQPAPAPATSAQPTTTPPVSTQTKTIAETPPPTASAPKPVAANPSYTG